MTLEKKVTVFARTQVPSSRLKYHFGERKRSNKLVRIVGV